MARSIAIEGCAVNFALPLVGAGATFANSELCAFETTDAMGRRRVRRLPATEAEY